MGKLSDAFKKAEKKENGKSPMKHEKSEGKKFEKEEDNKLKKDIKKKKRG